MSMVLPSELRTLLAAGAWPLKDEEANRQNVLPHQIPTTLVERFAPGESQIFLYPPPFPTIAECCECQEGVFWREFGALSEIDPDRAVIIGDFGLGSDAHIVLDYRTQPSPSLLRLAWTSGERSTHWVPFFDTFAAFS